MEFDKMPKQKIRDQLTIDIARYLKAGGKIKEIPYGEGAQVNLTKNQKLKFGKYRT
jgi:hypothetical protein